MRKTDGIEGIYGLGKKGRIPWRCLVLKLYVPISGKKVVDELRLAVTVVMTAAPHPLLSAHGSGFGSCNNLVLDIFTNI